MADLRRAVEDKPNGLGRDLVHFGRYLWFRKYVLPPPATTLDVGTGHFQLAEGALGDIINGTDSIIPHSQKFSVVGVEGNGEFVEQNKQRGFECVQCLLGKEAMPITDNSFNTVMAGEVMEHIPKKAWHFALKECFRVAVNQVLICTPYCGELHNKFEDFQKLEDHCFEPDEETMRKMIAICFPSLEVIVETIFHTPEECVCRGFHYARIIKKPWW